MANKPKTYDIVEIKWLDAEADPSWKTEDEVTNEGTGNLVVTIGLLIRRPNRNFPMYVVAGTATCDEETHFNNTMKIPKHWVKVINIIVKDYIVWQVNDPSPS
jgi:hypothetical protein